MRKKFLSYLAIFSLIMGLFVMGQTNTIYADNTKLNPDDMKSILNDISSVGKAWESMGFQSQDISEIMQLPRKNSNFYKGIEASVNELTNASKETKNRKYFNETRNYYTIFAGWKSTFRCGRTK